MEILAKSKEKWITIYKIIIIFLFIFLYNNIAKYLKKQLNNIKVSIIIPTFNREKDIIRAIKSVLNQTYKNIEVIVVDDGSKDKTFFMIQKIKDKRIRYIKLNRNTGGSNARNIGIKNALGNYIAFQDSDDEFYPNKIEKQLRNIINKKSDLDFCKIRCLRKNSHFYIYPNKRQEKSIIENNIFNELISRGNFISTQSILIKKNFIKEYYFDTTMPRLQDYELILRMIPKVKISYTKEVLVDLNLHKDSITNSKAKMIKAIDILLNKEFNFNLIQKKLFKKYLKYLQKKFHYKLRNNHTLTRKPNKTKDIIII